MSEIAPRSLDISKFKLLPNPEAEFMRDDIGLEYKQLPHKVKFGVKSYWELLKQKPNFAARIGFLVLTLMTLPVGLYERDSNVIFASTVFGKKLTRNIVYHENTHAWAYQECPDLVKTEKEVIKKLEGSNESRVAISSGKNPDIEKLVCQKVVDEGLATALGHEANTRFDLREKGILYDKNKLQSNTHLRPKRAAKAFNQAEKSAVQLTKAVTQNFFGSLINSLRGIFNLTRAQYVAGEFFCYVALSELAKRGQTVGQAAKTLIHNIPEKIEDIKNPVGYIDRITPKRQPLPLAA